MNSSVPDGFGFGPSSSVQLDTAAIAGILADLKWIVSNVTDIQSDNNRLIGLDTLEGAIALETLAQEIRQKVAKGG